MAKTKHAKKVILSKAYRMVVAGINPNGDPDLFFCKVRCSLDSFEKGKHNRLAEKVAKANDWEPKITFDEFDAAGKAMMRLFTWKTASIFDVQDKL